MNRHCIGIVLPVVRDMPCDCQIGTMYEYGIGVPQDYKQAEEWFIKGGPYGEPRWHLFMMYSRMASEGDIEAQYKLGLQYRYGGSVDQWDPSFGIDYKQALSLFRKLAEQGHADAQFQLAQMYNDGVGVTQNDVLAIYWYRKAAEQGVASAQFCLGIKYKLAKVFNRMTRWLRNGLRRLIATGILVKSLKVQ